MKPKLDLNFTPANIAILIVDDHPQIRKAIARVLTSLNFSTIYEAGTGSEAIKLLNETPVDLLICDLYLLDVSGIDVLEHVRNRDVNSDIPFLVVTGEASKEEIVKASDRGASDYLLKPFKSEDLTTKVIQQLNLYHNPSQILKLTRQAERLYVQKSFQKAQQFVEKALSLDSKQMTARHLKALILDQSGQHDAALQLHQQNAELNASYYRSFAAMAEIYLRQKRFPEAIDAILRELELNPRQPRRQTQIATLLLEVGRVEDAMKHFREALKENVKYMYALFGMGKCYASMGNLDKAIYYFKRVRRYYPTNTKCLEAMVKCCLDAGEPKRAEHALKDEKNANKTRLDTYLVLSKLYLAIDDKEKALQTMDELLGLKPDSIQAMKMKAAIYMRYKEINPAIDLYKQILSLEKDAETYIQYADVLMKCGNFVEATTQLYAAIQVASTGLSLMPRLAICYYKTSQYSKAIFIFEKLRLAGMLNEHMIAMQKECVTLQNQRRNTANKRLAS